MTRSRVLLGVPLLGIAVLVGIIVAAGGRSDDQDTLLERVTAAPSRYHGREVRVTGRVRSRPARVPPSVPGAFVLEAPDGGRLLVLPESSGDIPPVSDGLRVSVHGRVVPIKPSADDLGGDEPRDIVSISDLAARTRAAALLRADHVAARSG